jgi:hypothetical protein
MVDPKRSFDLQAHLDRSFGMRDFELLNDVLDRVLNGSAGIEVKIDPAAEPRARQVP